MKNKLLLGTGIFFGSILVLTILFRILFVTFIDSYELGYKFDTRNGKTTIIEKSGYVVEIPIIVSVHTIDLRPVQVCINANARVLNCKLVRFNRRGFDLFIAWHGRNDYSTDGTGRLKDILMSYAYDGSKDIEKNYPFIEILKELKPEPETHSNDTINENKADIKADTTQTH